MIILVIYNPRPLLRPQAPPGAFAFALWSFSALLLTAPLPPHTFAVAPTPWLQKSPAFSSWVRMKIAGHQVSSPSLNQAEFSSTSGLVFFLKRTLILSGY